MAEKVYETLGNGGLMYRVFDNGKELRIVTPEPLQNNFVNNEGDPDLWDWIDNASEFKKSEIRIPYTRIWIGKDPKYSDIDGFELIAEIGCYENICSYVFIGPTVTFFWTPQPIELYHSYVGNSGVVYGFAATKDYVYGFSHIYADQVIVVSRKLIEKHLGKSLSDKLTRHAIQNVTYNIMEIPYTTVKQERFHDNFNRSLYEPFDHARFQQIMYNTRLLHKRKTNYANTAIALGSSLPMNVSRHIATFRTGLSYRPYKKNTTRNNRSNSASNTNAVMGLLPANFHTGKNTVTTVSTKQCNRKKCVIMGGKRYTYKRSLK